MSVRYKVRSVIICDDARQEVSGKEIFIGVYNYSLLFARFPAAIPQLVLRVVITVHDKAAKTFSCQVKDPNGTILGHFGGDLTHANFDEPIGFGFLMVPVTFYAPGRYTIEFALDSDPPDVISDFEVRLPKDENERKRVPVIGA
jgi:hypothetical protein